MPRRPLRSFLAILMVAGSGVSGLVGASASGAPAEPVEPTGGCWRYVPGPGAEIDDATGITDLSTDLEPWAEDPKLTLGTAGDTAVGGARTFSLAVAGGPEVLPQLLGAEGSATYFFDVLDPKAQRTALAPVVVDFKLPAGASAIPAMRADGSFPLAVAGTSALILRAVYFDLPGLGQRLACNGQTTGDATTNPATTPIDTSVLASVTSVSTTSFTVGRVIGQEVTDTARAGDQVELAFSGFGSEATVDLGLCGPSTDAAASCGIIASVTTLPDGTSAKTVVVPSNAVTGAGSIRARSRIGASDVVLGQPLLVLGEPTVELRNTSAKNRLSVVGAEWDPLREVRVKAVDDNGDRVGSTVRVEAGRAGRIEARLPIPDDAEIAAVVAEQPRPGTALEATVDVPVDSAGSGDSDSNTGGDTSGTTGGSTGGDATNAPVAAPAEAPVDIPAPIDLPVTTVADPQAAAAAGADALAVTKVELAGSTRFADLFGGGPRRTLKLRVENVGAADVIAPGLSIAVGKGDESDPVYTSDGFGRLAPGKSREIAIPISLPTGAFGVYTVAGQIGEGTAGAFSVTLETYPWGLFGLNALAVLLIAFAVRRRIVAPASSRVAALIGAPGQTHTSPGSDAGAAVIDLAVLERWWALQTGDDPVREGVDVDAMADAVVDVEAVERWLERCSARNAVQG